MLGFYLVCALAGVGLLALQLVGAGLGDGDAHGHAGDHAHGAHVGHESLSHGLHLFSVRALTAGAALFGVTGWFATRAGWPSVVAFVAAVVFGLAGMVGVAMALRAMTRFESDGTLRVANAIGLDGTVHLRVPAAGDGVGKVMLTVQGRLMELPAVSSGPELPTGTAVTVVDVRGDDVLEVRSASTLSDEV